MAALIAMLLSCSGGSGNTGAFSATCGSDGDCGDGLICSKSGVSTGLCTQICKLDSECRTHFGDMAECLSGACVANCTAEKSACPSDSSCNLQARYCVHPAPPQNWTCEVTLPGICECRVTDQPGTMTRCPSELNAFHTTVGFDNHDDVCCELGGPSQDPATWNYCTCQSYRALTDSETCYDRPIANGVEYGPAVEWCPGGPHVSY